MVKFVRTGRPPLEIGEAPVIYEGDSGGAQANRWHEIAVHDLGDGRLAVAVAYQSQWHGEASHADALVCRHDDLARALAAIDPLAHVKGYPSGEQYADRQRRLECDIRERWEALLTDLYESVDVAESPESVERDYEDSQELARYRQICARMITEEFGDLSEAECSAICDALNGTMIDEHSAAFIAAEISDADRLNGLGAKWGIDGQTLARRLHESSIGAKFAIAEAARKFWSDHHAKPTVEALRACGLLRQ